MVQRASEFRQNRPTESGQASLTIRTWRYARRIAHFPSAERVIARPSRIPCPRPDARTFLRSRRHESSLLFHLRYPRCPNRPNRVSLDVGFAGSRPCVARSWYCRLWVLRANGLLARLQARSRRLCSLGGPRTRRLVCVRPFRCLFQIVPSTTHSRWRSRSSRSFPRVRVYRPAPPRDEAWQLGSPILLFLISAYNLYFVSILVKSFPCPLINEFQLNPCAALAEFAQNASTLPNTPRSRHSGRNACQHYDSAAHRLRNSSMTCLD